MMEKILTKEELGKLMEDLKKRGVFAGSGHIPKQKELINTALALYKQLGDIENRRKVLVEKWEDKYKKITLSLQRRIIREIREDLKGLEEGK